MAYVMVNGKKKWVHEVGKTKVVKKPIVDTYSLSEVYIKDEKGGLMKQGELRGTRAQVVTLRRDIRSKLNLTGDRIILYVSGQLRKVGIDKGVS